MSNNKVRSTRIYNPVTGKYYELQLRTSKKGRKRIRNLWKQPKEGKTLLDIVLGK